MFYRSYSLLELARKRTRLRIRGCPRCGGFVYWPYRVVGTRLEKEIFRDKVKCFMCGRMFYLAQDGEKAVWKQWPEREEQIVKCFESLGGAHGSKTKKQNQTRTSTTFKNPQT